MKVYAIFSIANNYDQPENNLEILFQNKPNFENLKTFFFDQLSIDELSIDELRNSDIMFLVDLMRGKSVRLDGTEYRIEELPVIAN